ncbi:MAG: cbb3-type cytochrome c oxidase subunit II [Dehalococcoidia bacterium]
MGLPPNMLRLAAGSFLLLLIGIGGTILLPYLVDDPRTAAGSLTPEEARGRTIYKREGCWYCHTQQVRSTEANKGTVTLPGDIGPETVPEDYVGQRPTFWGTERQGPDLSHTGSRQSAVWQREHLKNPQSTSPGSIMPSFGYLPVEEIDALVAYLMSLK